MDINKIYEALGNEKNENIINTNTYEIEIEKNNIIDELSMSEDDYNMLYDKLIDYRYCSKPCDVNIGCSIIWIPLHNNDKAMSIKHGRVAKRYETQDDVNILYFLGGKMFTIKFSEIIIFQKLSQQEKTILQLIDNI